MSSERGENEILRDHKNVGYHVGRVKTLALKRTKTKSSTKKQSSCRRDFHPPSHDHQREEELNSIMAFHEPFVFLVTLLAFLVGLHFQALNISPIETHFAIILLLIIAAVVYSIAYASPIFQTHNTEYLPIFRPTCLASGILTCELLISLLISPLWWFLINLCISLIVEILRRWHQPIYNYVDQIHNWLQQKFQSVCEAASRTFSLTQSTS